MVDAADALQVADIEGVLGAAIAGGSARSAPISMPTSMLVVLDSIAAARPALSGAVVLHARNADRAADARRALLRAEAVVVGDVETSGTARMAKHC